MAGRHLGQRRPRRRAQLAVAADVAARLERAARDRPEQVRRVAGDRRHHTRVARAVAADADKRLDRGAALDLVVVLADDPLLRADVPRPEDRAQGAVPDREPAPVLREAQPLDPRLFSGREQRLEGLVHAVQRHRPHVDLAGVELRHTRGLG